MYYDHGSHAGNAGDVWKHFILAEAADCLASRRRRLVYAESHVGYPHYSLEGPGEWRGGIGRCWRCLPALREFPYFEILAEMNPGELRLYPGSATLAAEVARRRGCILDLQVWDIHPGVAAAWHDRKGAGFHLGDGFVGVKAFLEGSNPGLLLIDPPYLDGGEAEKAQGLLSKAERAGWTVLLYIMSPGALPELGFGLEMYPLSFADAGMDCGRWKGAAVALAGADGRLLEHLEARALELLRILRSEPF
jgi:23S rRNA (adenine2030-N6)-methyltransferase